jgi:hypothetical protein
MSFFSHKKLIVVKLHYTKVDKTYNCLISPSSDLIIFFVKIVLRKEKILEHKCKVEHSNQTLQAIFFARFKHIKRAKV